MQEREAPAVDVAAQRARREVALGLQLLAGNPETIDRFAWAAGQIAGAPDAQERILGMIRYAMELAKYAHGRVDEAIETSSGVPVEVIVSPTRDTAVRTDCVEPARGKEGYALPGHLVALVGASRGVFYGAAVVPTLRGGQDFVAVSVTTNGRDITTRFLPENLKLEYKGLPGLVVTQDIIAQKLAQNYMRDGRPRSAS